MSATINKDHRQTFRKTERLAGKKTIEQLVNKGRILTVTPFRLIWMPTKLKTAFPIQIAFSVPKRNFRLAVQRNRVKRLMREVYRKNKSILYTLLKSRDQQCALLIIYTGKSLPVFKEVEQKLNLTLQSFVEDLQKYPL